MVTPPTYDAALLVADLETAIADELTQAVGFEVYPPTLAIREVVARYFVWSREARVLCGGEETGSRT
jgi:hypothetical protein